MHDVAKHHPDLLERCRDAEQAVLAEIWVKNLGELEEEHRLVFDWSLFNRGELAVALRGKAVFRCL